MQQLPLCSRFCLYLLLALLSRGSRPPTQTVCQDPNVLGRKSVQMLLWKCVCALRSVWKAQLCKSLSFDHQVPAAWTCWGLILKLPPPQRSGLLTRLLFSLFLFAFAEECCRCLINRWCVWTVQGAPSFCSSFDKVMDDGSWWRTRTYKDRVILSVQTSFCAVACWEVPLHQSFIHTLSALLSFSFMALNSLFELLFPPKRN